MQLINSIFKRIIAIEKQTHCIRQIPHDIPTYCRFRFQSLCRNICCTDRYIRI